MLDILRANTRSVLTYVLFGIIIVVFVVSFGPGSRGCTETGGGAATWAAEVGGQTVGAAEYEGAYARLYRAYQGRLGSAFTPELADQLGLRSLALNQLVDRELVLAEARRHGVAVTDDELSRTIQRVPAFQTDGRFDMELYKRAVASSYGSPAKFEAGLRRDLEFQKMLALVRSAVKVPDDEVREAWLADHDRASLEFVRFPLSAARAEVRVTDAEAQAFAAANGARVEQFYKDNPSRYQTKKRVRARHILVKVPEGASPAEEEAARKKIGEVAKRLEKGEDFAALARQVSDDAGSRDRGGELGFFGEGVMAKPFEEAAFALPPGGISPPIRTRFGWHVLQVEEVQAPESVPLEKARVGIAREILEQEGARKVAARRAEDALRKLEAGKRLADLFPAPDPKRKVEPARLGGQPLAVESTGPFGRGDLVPLVGRAPGLAADAFAADSGQVLRKVYETTPGPLVAVVKARERPDPARFAEQREDAARRLRNRREGDVEEAWLRSLRERTKIQVNQALLRGAPAAPPADLE